jgi:predicted CoA-binding protein
MVSKDQIQEFLAQRTIALVGLSRSGQAFSNNVHRELKARGYRVYPINPNADTIQGEPCYASLTDLPEPVAGALFFTPPAETEKAVSAAVAAGIRHLWLQQGAETAEAIRAGQAPNINLVAGECIFMFLPPVALPHKLHGWFKGVMGQMPR